MFIFYVYAFISSYYTTVDNQIFSMQLGTCMQMIYVKWICIVYDVLSKMLKLEALPCLCYQLAKLV